MTTSDAHILVLGLGNTLLTDEAVGVRVLENLAAKKESETHELKLLDGGTMGLTLLVEMEDAEAMIIIDSAYLNAAPGTVQVFEGEEMDLFLRTRSRNAHDIGLDDLMDALSLRQAVPHKRALSGVQPADLSVGETLTDAVAQAVPEAASRVVEIARKWRSA
jgi:hydrogenase maturation protease